MKHSPLHAIKLIFKKIQWSLDLLSWARKNDLIVDNFKLLIAVREEMHKELLEKERQGENQRECDELKIQIDLLNRIIQYGAK